MQEKLPLTWPQKSWFMGWTQSDKKQNHVLTPHVYNLARNFKITPLSLDEGVIRRIGKVIFQHSSLTSRISGEGMVKRVQQIYPNEKAYFDDFPKDVLTVPEWEISEATSYAKSLTFDLQKDKPIKLILGIKDSRIHSVSTILDHSACDWWGLRVLKQQITASLGKTNDKSNPQIFDPAFDLLRFQASAEGRIQCQIALDHWNSAIEQMRGNQGLDCTLERRWKPNKAHNIDCVQVRSKTIWRHVEHLSQKFNVNPSTVYLHAASKTILRLLGEKKILIHNTVPNRILPGSKSSVSTMYMRGPVLVNLDYGSPAESLRSIAIQQVRNHRFSLFNPVLVDEALQTGLAGFLIPELFTTSYNFAPPPPTSMTPDVEGIFEDRYLEDPVVVHSEYAPGGRPVKLWAWHTSQDSCVKLDVRADSPLHPEISRFPRELMAVLRDSLY